MPRWLGAWAVMGWLWPAPVLAFGLSPISRDFSPSGSGAMQTYQIVNDSASPIALNVTVNSRSYNLDGEEENADAEDDFLIYPPQFIVPAHGRQTLRVTWLGDAKPRHELAYRLVVEQLPIERLMPKPAASDVAKGTGQLHILMVYQASIYIRPANVGPVVKTQSADVIAGEAGGRSLAVVLKNDGNGRSNLKKVRLKVRAQGKQVELSPKSLGLKTNVLLAGAERRLVFPWPEQLPVAPPQVTPELED